MELAIIIIVCIIILLIMLISTSWILADIILKPAVLENDILYQRELESGRLTESLYQSWIKTDFDIKSRYGYTLSCQLINNEISEDQLINPSGKIKIAILCHGYTCGKYSSMMYADLFLKRGITVLTYDHRNHGFSGKAYTSMGYYEKYDLQTVVDWCFETYGPNLSIVTQGESMGAATVLSHLAIDGRVRCSIADCGFSNLKELTKYQLKKYYHIPAFPFLYIAGILIKLRAGFWFYDVAPIEGVMQTNAPVLFIHGEEDHFIPATMTQTMYEAKPEKKELYIAPNAKHGESCQKNRKEYKEVLDEFLDHYYFI
ncbi:MAG: hypothetical protein K0R92_752 [Lachnospiraceae bacterium]|jgi:fermentation-respiration switch protein FrsA (DUF1100 family)|nr:hypothetical protein [Lachnospiraceae bacterium]